MANGILATCACPLIAAPARKAFSPPAADG